MLYLLVWSTRLPKLANMNFNRFKNIQGAPKFQNRPRYPTCIDRGEAVRAFEELKKTCKNATTILPRWVVVVAFLFRVWSRVVDKRVKLQLNRLRGCYGGAWAENDPPPSNWFIALKRWLQLRFDFDSTAVRRSSDLVSNLKSDVINPLAAVTPTYLISPRP